MAGEQQHRPQQGPRDPQHNQQGQGEYDQRHQQHQPADAFPLAPPLAVVLIKAQHAHSLALDDHGTGETHGQGTASAVDQGEGGLSPQGDPIILVIAVLKQSALR